MGEAEEAHGGGLNTQLRTQLNRTERVEYTVLTRAGHVWPQEVEKV